MGLFNFLDGLITQFGEDVRAKQNRDWSSEEAQKNRDFQLQMYDKQLDDNIAWRTHQELYNSPSAQMQRYRDAGINPMYAVTGSGGNSVVSPMSMAGGFGSSAPSGSKSDTLNTLEYRMARQRMDNENKVSDAQARMYDSQAKVYDETAEGIDLDNARKEIESGYWASNAYQQSRGMIKVNQLNDEQRALMRKQGAEIDKHIEQIQEQINLHKADVAKRLLEVRHQAWYTDFMQSIAPYEARKLELAVSQLEHDLNIKAFQDSMKKTSYWLNFGTQIVGSVCNVLASIKGLSFAPINSVNQSFTKQVGNEIQSPESMMGTYDIIY